MTAASDTLRGNVERVDRTGIAGWARNANDPATPVVLDIMRGDHRLGQIAADQYRADLDQPGMQGGRHGFWFVFDPPLDATQRHLIAVRRVADGAHVPGSPLLLDRLDALDAASVQTLMDMAADHAFAADLQAYAVSRRAILVQRRAELARLREIT